MASARKLSSGSWRCRVFDHIDDNGKKVYKSFTSNDKTSRGKREAERMAAEYAATKENRVTRIDMTISMLLEKYILSKAKTLSTTTIIGYESMENNLFKDISKINIKNFNSEQAQVWIGNISINHSPKTVKNAYGLLTSALEMFYPEKVLKVKLPQKKKQSVYVPTDQDVKVLIKYFSEHDPEMLKAVVLAAVGTMRRSELCALTADDVDGNVIHINKALVATKDKQWVLKVTKTTESQRDVIMPQHIIDILPKSGNLVNINPARVSDRFIKAIKRLDIKRFRFHDLRHYSASVMHALGVPDEYIMKRGGWKSDSTLKTIYRGCMDDFEQKFTNITVEHFDALKVNL